MSGVSSLPPWIKQKVEGLYVSGYKQVEIAAQLGISQTTVSKIVIQIGLSKRIRKPCVPEPNNRGEPICKVCHSDYVYSIDTIYGATLEKCKCGLKILSRGWQAA